MGCNFDQEIGNLLYNIAWLRRRNGLSKREMARRLGIGVASLNAIERGELPNVSVEIFFNIEKSFGIHPKDQLAGRLGEDL